MESEDKDSQNDTGDTNEKDRNEQDTEDEEYFVEVKSKATHKRSHSQESKDDGKRPLLTEL